ncbi:hypothetical protein [Actinomyces gaoshouyii]|uniref:Uncharacterized protein n=1 Tax=Actinomyces gaoshouyii TaxID=1960083 RepID=A0A8H9LIH8_9ACTO|nr:hypothetical protein [Actinomyces gaoshouyii]GGO96378.1 hypothetical protein GCM10011612_06440 [Actinomyces gaoshouyii]
MRWRGGTSLPATSALPSLAIAPSHDHHTQPIIRLTKRRLIGHRPRVALTSPTHQEPETP